MLMLTHGRAACRRRPDGERDLRVKSTVADGLVRYESNQTTFNTAFLLFVLSRVEVFSHPPHPFFPEIFSGWLLWGQTCQVSGPSRFIY